MEGPDPHKPCQWRAVNQGAAEGEDPGPGSYWHDGRNRMRSTLTRALISDQTSAADMGGGAAKRSPHHLQLPNVTAAANGRPFNQRSPGRSPLSCEIQFPDCSGVKPEERRSESVSKRFHTFENTVEPTESIHTTF